MEQVEVAAGVVRDARGRVLICQRMGELAGLWEFPGGKRERGESFAECLRRELLEELSLEVMPEGEICRMPFVQGTKRMQFCFLLARLEMADPCITLTVHQDIRWVSTGQLASYPLCPADEAFLRDFGHLLDSFVSN
ncbi:MAG: NUDIX domain-containing protein [Clostridiales bacterium]|nr:NUDIX domain-containing protein [Clostridiales bacterium]